MQVMLGTPVRSGFPTDYVKSLWSTRLRASTMWYPVSGLAVDVARNVIVEYFLKHSKSDYLVMHDSDATWHPDAIARLIALDLPFVSAVIYQRAFPTVPFIGYVGEVRDNGETVYSFQHAAGRVIDVALANRYEPKEERAVLFDSDVVEEIDGCGAHFAVIRRDVLEAVEPPYYLVTHPPSGGEDFYFCRKVKEAGFGVYVNYAVHTGHIAGDGVTIGLREFMLYSYRGKRRKRKEG